MENGFHLSLVFRIFAFTVPVTTSEGLVHPVPKRIEAKQKPVTSRLIVAAAIATKGRHRAESSRLRCLRTYVVN